MVELNNMYKLEMMVPYRLSCVSMGKNCKPIPFQLSGFKKLWCHM